MTKDDMEQVNGGKNDQEGREMTRQRGMIANVEQMRNRTASLMLHLVAT
jgi:hypothetical protein